MEVEITSDNEDKEVHEKKMDSIQEEVPQKGSDESDKFRSMVEQSGVQSSLEENSKLTPTDGIPGSKAYSADVEDE